MRRFFARLPWCTAARLAWRGTLVLTLAGGLAWAGRVALRQYYAQQLIASTSSVDDAQAADRIRALGELDATGIDALVAAATSPRAAVALTARDELDSLLDRWSRGHDLNPRSYDLASRIAPLSAALRTNVEGFDTSSHTWVRGTVLSLLELADDQASSTWKQVIGDCQWVLDRLEPPAGAPVNSLATSWPPLTTPLAAEPAESVVTKTWTPRAAEPTEPLAPPAPLTEPAPLVAATPVSASPSAAPAVAANSPVAEPISVLPQLPSTEPAELTPATSVLPDELIADVSLLMQVAGDDLPLATEAARELAGRGYGRVGQRPAKMLLSRSVDDRLALVNAVSTSADLAASKWLTLLAYDGAGEVRAAAVGALALTNDPQLRRWARERALYDRDPRVAAWAEKLRDVN